MKNRTGRKILERLYGKGCFMERAGIREITPEQEEEYKRTIKGFKKLDRTITYHHIRERRNGGEVSRENGANLAAYNHQWLNMQTPEVQAQVNSKLREFKWRIDMARISIGDQNLEFDKLDIDISMEDTIEIPVYDNSILEDKELRKVKFNRAKQKRETQRLIKENFEDWER